MPKLGDSRSSREQSTKRNQKMAKKAKSLKLSKEEKRLILHSLECYPPENERKNSNLLCSLIAKIKTSEPIL